MFILCTGTKTIYNSDNVVRYLVCELDEDDEGDNGERYAIVGDSTDRRSYCLAYYDTEEEANEAMLNMMEQVRQRSEWILL